MTAVEGTLSFEEVSELYHEALKARAEGRTYIHVKVEYDGARLVTFL